ncbi:MAG: hypothetical protein M3076_18270 [Actinomycetota bacterium]|nr:hypothetical protein [Actinomycetota bacterium]
MSGIQFTPCSGAEHLLELHAAELPQKNELCGAFWGTLALRAAGVSADGGPIDQDAVGISAGSVLSATQLNELPAGEPGRTDYRVSFPTVDDPTACGTSADGLVRALRELSSGSLGVLPIAGPWTPASVQVVLEAATACTQPCTLIANLATSHLWGSRTSPQTLLAYLSSGNSDFGPPPDWDVGHFVGLLGAIKGPCGTLVVVADTYRALGWDGLHVQPIEGLAHALARTGSNRPSGVILVASSEEAADVERRIGDAGLEMRTWENGSPDMTQAR